MPWRAGCDGRRSPLVAFYVLAGLFGWPLLVIAVVGLLDALVRAAAALCAALIGRSEVERR